jgi:alanyl-tRNA synthetase
MTQCLHYQNPYLRAFDARVIDRRQVEGQPGVVLDATAFYASGGGQPSDTGTLNSVPVLEVRATEDGQILHLLGAPLADAVVHGEVDWERRFDHMQQHTGQHILSQAFVQSARAETIGFHMGESDATIDLDMAPMAGEQITASELLANTVVIDDRGVMASFVSEQELAAMPLRKRPAVEGPVRIVQVEGFDWSPCGGTHVRASGEVGPIKVIRTERRKDMTRIHFLCGWRALRDYARKHQNVQTLASHLTTSEDEIGQSVERLEARTRDLQKALSEAQLDLMRYQVPEWASRAEVVNGIRVVRLAFDEGDVAWLKEIARRLTQQPGIVALLATRRPAPQFVFARSEGIALDVADLMRASCAAVGGRGGGRSMLAQGGAPEGACADTAIGRAMIELGRS